MRNRRLDAEPITDLAQFKLSLQLETAIQNWITMALEVNWETRHRLRLPSLATLRHPDYHPQVERRVALRTQTRVVLVGPIESRSNHGGSNPLSKWGVSRESLT